MEQRHVRDMWSDAFRPGRGQSYGLSELEAGALLIFRRQYDIGGAPQVVAGHMALVSCFDSGALSYIHANSSTGIVEERVMQSSRNVLGTIAINMQCPYPLAAAA